VGRPAARAPGVDRRRHRAPGLERQQPRERLGPGLWLSVLALPPRRVPRRRRLRPVLRRDARAGRGGGDHQRNPRPAGGPEPGLGAHPRSDEGRSPSRRRRRPRRPRP
jgi:hypothetical protein